MSKGKIFYELRRKGLTNHQIAERYGLKPPSVGARISEHRLKNNLPHVPHPGTTKRGRQPRSTAEIKTDTNGCKNVSCLIYDAEEHNKKLAEKAFVRSDGVIQCPTVYCHGYGGTDNSH